MKDGRYFSETEGRYCWVYHIDLGFPLATECMMCGKIGTGHNSLVWEDDDQNLEYIYGNECIKKLKLKKAY